MKALLWFWAAVLAVVIGGAAALQALGPPMPAAAPAPRTAAVEAPALGNLHPVALVLDGVGLDQALSERAIRALPRAVTLGFSAYTPDGTMERIGADAHLAGHECLVSIPMQPGGAPFADEGTRALAVGADPARNHEMLQAVLARIGFCIGATGASDGQDGARFAASGPPFDEMLGELGRRGLIYLDPRPGIATPDRPGMRAADLVIDRQPDPNAPVTAALLDERLAGLEQIARERGSAIGLAGPPLPVIIDRIAAWAAGLNARGVALVPVSRLLRAPH